MTKEEKTRAEVRDENGVEVIYLCSPVRHGGNQVGYAPRRKMVDLNEMLGVLSPEKIYSLADRQLDQDMKNAVRAKFTKDKLSGNQTVKLLAEGKLKVVDITKAQEFYKGAKGEDLFRHSFTAAAEIVLGVGKDAKVEPNKIHWDILPAVEEVEVEEEVVEEVEE